MVTADSMAISGLLSLREAVKLSGLSAGTLRKYASQGLIEAYRVGSLGHRRFCRESLRSFLGMDTEEKNQDDGAKDDQPLIAYCRCSSDGQKESLQRQTERVRKYCHEHYGREPVIYSEIGSSLNFKRKKLTQLVRNIIGGKYDNGLIVMEYKDRGMRLGFELLQTIADCRNIKIVVIEKNEAKSDNEEFIQDTMSFLTLMANRLTAAKAAKVNRRHVSNETLNRIKELRGL